MITDPLTGARKPEQTDGPLGGLQIANVVDDLAPNTIPSFANAAARNTEYSNWVAAGGVMRKGLKSHTQNDDRYWRYDGSGWQYAGGASPPIVLCTLVTGWVAIPERAPAVYRDGDGLVHLVGGIRPQSTYNPNDGTPHTAITLPAGYRPTLAVPLMAQTASGHLVGGTIGTDGVLNFTVSLLTSAPAGMDHYLDGIPPFHPGYVGGALS